MFWGDFCLVPWVHPLYRHMCARVYGMKPRRASVWVWVCAKKFGIVQVGKWRRPERQMHDSFPSQADLSFLALGLVCLLRLMIWPLCCISWPVAKRGFVAFWDFGCLEERIFFTTSGPKRMNSDDPAALITHLPFTFWQTKWLQT